jgi:hypothetical protein
MRLRRWKVDDDDYHIEIWTTLACDALGHPADWCFLFFWSGFWAFVATVCVLEAIF